MSKKPPPLLGYNTNVRHHGNLFHIQTEDSGVDHPHIITHLFVEGTILATMKRTYEDVLTEAEWETKVRAMMKDQHRNMFIELRDGVHDETAARIFGTAPEGEAPEDAVSAVDDAEVEDDETLFDESVVEETTVVDVEEAARTSMKPPAEKPPEQEDGVRVIRPADMTKEKQPDVAASADAPKPGAALRYRSVFDTPDDDGEFGENLITDKSLDEVILSYLTDELDE
jgi:hypothetical protein